MTPRFKHEQAIGIGLEDQNEPNRGRGRNRIARRRNAVFCGLGITGSRRSHRGLLVNQGHAGQEKLMNRLAGHRPGIDLEAEIAPRLDKMGECTGRRKLLAQQFTIEGHAIQGTQAPECPNNLLP